jgi:hypothetical protein
LSNVEKGVNMSQFLPFLENFGNGGLGLGPILNSINIEKNFWGGF